LDDSSWSQSDREKGEKANSGQIFDWVDSLGPLSARRAQLTDLEHRDIL